MALLYPAVVPCSVILSLIAVDCFTGPTINSADLNDIGVAQFHQFFRCLLTPITAAAVYQNQLIFMDVLPEDESAEVPTAYAVNSLFIDLSCLFCTSEFPSVTR